MQIHFVIITLKCNIIEYYISGLR